MIYFVLLATLMGSGLGEGADDSASLRVEQITVADGLPGNSVITIHQDRLGLLWMGTTNGLVKYDGYIYTTYTPQPYAANSLSHPLVVALFEDADGILWVGTAEGGLNRFDPKTETFEAYRHVPDDAASLSSDHVRAVVGTSDGLLWVGTEHGLNRFDPKTGRATRYYHRSDDHNSLAHDLVKSIYVHPDGSLWIGTFGGLSHFDPITDQFTTYKQDPSDPHTLSSDHVSHVYGHPHQPDVLWVGAGDYYHPSLGQGLNRLQLLTGKVTRYGTAHGLSDLNVMFVTGPSSGGSLWVATRQGGLFQFDPQQERFSPRARATLEGKTVLAVHEDAAGLLWAGTAFNGIYKLDRHAYKATSTSTTAYGRLYTLHEHTDQTLWLGTDQGLWTWQPEQWQIERGANINGAVVAIAEGPQETLWLGTKQGLYHYNPATQQATAYPYQASEVPILDIEADADGNLWLGTRGQGLMLFDVEHRQFTAYHLDAQEAYNGNIVSRLTHLDDALLWVQSPEGGQIFNRQKRRFEARPDWLEPFQEVRSVLHDTSESVWIGSGQWGLYRWDPRQQVGRFFTEADGLASDVVWRIVQDNEGNVWAATARGVSRFDPQNEVFTNYGKEEGVWSDSHRWHTALQAQDGHLYFGTPDEVVAFHPPTLTPSAFHPPTHLTDVSWINDEGQSVAIRQAAEAVIVAYHQRNVTLRFAALSYRFPERNRYAYRLVGYDHGWQYVGTQRYATYTNLPPGSYTFEVKAANSDGMWSEQATTLALTVRPPWWRTPWAYLAYGAVLVLAFTGVVKLRVRYLEQQNRQLEATVAARTAKIAFQQQQLRQQHKDLEEQHQQVQEAKAVIERQAAQLAEIDAMKSRFFANLSHEFRTPLTLILGPLHDMRTGVWGRVSADMQRHLALMQDQGQRLLRLVNQLLDLAKLEAGRTALRPVLGELVGFVEGVVRSFAPRAEQTAIVLQCHSGVRVWGCAFDADALEKILTNLIANAMQFTAAHGKVRVTLAAEADAVTFRIQDTGEGIPEAVIPHIFDRFASQPSGTGIGLALVHELVELHEGTIDVTSEVGFGTTVTVQLPLKKAPGDPHTHVQQHRMDSPDTAGWNGNGRSATDLSETSGDGAGTPLKPTVLVVEDHAEVRAYLCSHLRQHYTVIEATDGEEAWVQVHEHAVDVVVSDVMLPGMDGFALCERIKGDGTYGTTPVILLTARGAAEDRMHGLTLGADDYIAKPFVGEEVRVRIANLLANRQRLRRRFSEEVRVGPEEIIVPSYEAVLIEQVRTVVEARLGESSFGVEALADEVGLSARQLQRRLKASTNLSVAAYIRKVRLQRAAQLLAQQSGTVSEISYAVGFKNADHFSALFRRTFGITPSQYMANPTQPLLNQSSPKSKAL